MVQGRQASSKQAPISNDQIIKQFWLLEFDDWSLFGYCLPRTVLVRGCLPCTMSGTGLGIWLLGF
jgi:hypothetical protein